MSKQIKTDKATIRYLSDVNHLRGFIIELQQHLKERVYFSQDKYGKPKCCFNYDPDDYDILDDIDCNDLHDRDIPDDIDWMKCFIVFCIKKHLNWAAAYKMYSCFIDEYRHGSDLIVNHKIDDKCNADPK